MIRALVDSDAVESASALLRVRAIVQRARGISVAGATRCPQGTRSVSENGRSVKFASLDPANPAYPRNVVPTRNSISMGTQLAVRLERKDGSAGNGRGLETGRLLVRVPLGCRKVLAQILRRALRAIAGRIALNAPPLLSLIHISEPTR